MNIQLKYIDLGLIFVLTLGAFLFYVIYAAIYFIKVDKKIKLDISGNNHGLSRMCLQGIFFLFGLLIFDLSCEFGQVFLNAYINSEQKTQFIDQFMNNSFSFYSLINKYRFLPIELFINGMFVVSFFYIGVEGLISSLKTMNIESGLRIELPEKKRKRLSNIFYIWCFLSLITTVYTILVGSDDVNFCNKNCIFSTIVTLIVIILSERSPSALENVKIVKSKDSEKVNLNFAQSFDTVPNIINFDKNKPKYAAADVNRPERFEKIKFSDLDIGK